MKSTVIGIAGGTASGKTSIAKKLEEYIENKGTVAVIRLDDYYYGKSKMVKDENGNYNFDHPDAYDIDLLISQINDLVSGKPINKPIYDFVTSSRTDKTEVVNPAEIIIIESIFALTIKRLRKFYDIKIYVDTADDIRFIRRLKRDMIERGRTLDSVVNQYVSTVRPMHYAFVEPSKVHADLIIPEGAQNYVALDLLYSKIDHILANNRKESKMAQ